MKIKLENLASKLKQRAIGIRKNATIPLISFAMGFGAGKLGKATNHEEIPAIPVVVDLLFGSIHSMNPIPYLFYGAGVACNYLPEIYQALQNLTN